MDNTQITTENPGSVPSPSPAQIQKDFKQHNNFTGGGLLLYFMIFLGIQLVYQIKALFNLIMTDPTITSADRREEYLKATTDISSNGWVFIISLVVGLTALFIFFRKRLPAREIFVSGKKMTGKGFITVFFLFFGAQGIGQIICVLLEKLLNLIGLSNEATNEMLDSLLTNNLSILLYTSIFGPIAEELVFRGFLLRRFQAGGRLFAIVMTSILFGLFHMNFVQIPYATIVGLVLAYVALEYGILWSIILHIINNGLFAVGFDSISKALGDDISGYIQFAFLAVCIIVAAIIIVINRIQASDYINSNRTAKVKYSLAFSAPTLIIFVLISIIFAIVTLISLG
jgi:hypothetical protein